MNDFEKLLNECYEIYGNGYFAKCSSEDGIHFVFAKKICELGELHLFRNCAGAIFAAIYVDGDEEFSCCTNEMSEIAEMIKYWSSDEYQEVLMDGMKEQSEMTPLDRFFFSTEKSDEN